MKKTNFTILKLVLPVFMACWGYCFSYAQVYCSMNCNDNVQVSLNQDCEALITYDLMLEDGNNPAICTPNGAQAFSISVQDAWGNEMPSSPYVNGNHIGIDLTVEVTHTATGNKCWGTISIEDKQHPYIYCEDRYVPCNESPLPGNVGYPDIEDNCDSNPDVDYYDVWTDLDCPSPYAGYWTRTWTVCDDSGNCASCDERIYVERLDFAALLPPADINLECFASTHPNNTGWPTINGVDITPDFNGGPCDVAVDYTDQTLALCSPNTFKIIRTWIVLDWCNNATHNFTQIIKVLDNGTSITCPADYTISTDAYHCDAHINLPAASVNETCSDYTVQTFWSGGSINGNGGQVELPKGTHVITYVVTDACGNTDDCDLEITVVDLSPPIAICDAHTVVTLNPDCDAIIYAETFDDGSHDNCCGDDLTFEVRRMSGGPSWAPYIAFGYNDCVNGPIMVRMRVTDCFGNEAECMVEVEVDDKTPPTITCPDNITLGCYDDYADLNLTNGSAVGYDACCVEEPTYTDQVFLNECNIGFIRRRWRVYDCKGNGPAQCTQIITLEDFDNVNVNFPPDRTYTDCREVSDLDPDDLSAPFDGPSISGDGCELMAVNHTDEVFYLVDETCFKIIRYWTVINWCVYNPEDPNSEGRWEGVQVLKVLNNEAPVFDTPCDDVTICTYDLDCEPTYVEIMAAATDDCTATESLDWFYWIDLHNTSGYIDEVDASGNSTDASGNYPLGTHFIKWKVKDGCGNFTICEYHFTIEDCKKPTPVCIDGLTVDIMDLTPDVSDDASGMIEVWAIDFESFSSYDNCTDYDNLIFRIRKGAGSNNPPSTSAVSFDCDELGLNLVELWARDEAGNWDYCVTQIIVQDNMGACAGPLAEMASITGNIEDEMLQMVEDVNMNITGANNNPFTTGATGYYEFLNLPMNQNYTVNPEKDVDPLNGVTTFDLVLMSRHILGVETLSTPYKIIAADANNSGSVTTLDLVTVRRLILNIDTEFANNTSWRFVDKSYSFPNAANPFAAEFPEVISFNDIAANEVADFYAVKVGDVNNSAVPVNYTGTENRGKNGSLVMTVNDSKVKAGETVTVDFTASDFNNVAGYQFTIEFNQEALGFVDVKAGALSQLTANNFGLTRLSEGAITTSWNEVEAVSIKDDVTLFSMTFNALNNVNLSDVISFSSQITAAEAYIDNAVKNVELAFNTEAGTTIANNFALYQNQPNPFSTETVISFNLPQAGTASLKVYDLSGKTLKVVAGNYAKGYNQITISKSELSGAGVLYYQLDTPTATATKKMFIVD